MITAKLSKINAEDLRMLLFEQEDFIDGPFMKFIEFRRNKEFKNIFFKPGPHSFFVHKDSIPLFRSKGFHFRVIKPIKTKLTVRQLEAIENGKAMRIPLNGTIFFVKLPKKQGESS